MEIKGKTYLNVNDFNNIIINLKNNDYNVAVSSIYKRYYNKNDKIISQISNLTSDKQVYEIVNYFLRYSNIFKVIYDNNFKICVYGTNNRTLMLELKNNEFSKKFINNIIYKYENDRLNNMCKSKTSLITGNMQGSWYTGNENTKYYLNVVSENGKQELLEKDFLRELVLSILDGKKAYIDTVERKKENLDWSWKEHFLVCGNERVLISSPAIIREIEKILLEYNKNLEENNSLQYKLKI